MIAIKPATDQTVNAAWKGMITYGKISWIINATRAAIIRTVVAEGKEKNDANEKTRDNSRERTVTFEEGKFLERVEDPKDWDKQSFNFIARKIKEEEDNASQTSADDDMPALEEHDSSNNAITLEYVASTNDEDKYTFLFKEENNKDIYMFKGIDKINPRKVYNVIYAGDEKIKSSKESDESCASMSGLFQPTESSDKESNDVPKLIPRDENSEEEKENI